LDRRDRQRIVAAFDMRFALAFLLILSALGAAQTSPPPRNGAKQQQGSKNKAGNPQPLPNATVHTAENQPSPTKKEQSPEEKPQCILKKAFAPDTWANWALFIAAMTAAVIALKTLKAIQHESEEIKGVAGEMGRATKEMQAAGTLASDTAEKQLRAYVCVDSALLKFKRPDVPEVQVHYSNRGQTPAYDVRSWIHMWIERHPLTVTLPLPPDGFQMGMAVLAPGAKPYVQVIEKKPPVPMNVIRQVGTPEGTIYVYGEIRYKDIFQKERLTKFRLIYGGPGGARNKTENGIVTALLNPDTEGNEAT
jgi:hypothetical protein